MNGIFELPPILSAADGAVDMEAWRNYELRRTQQLQERFAELEARVALLEEQKGEVSLR